LADALKAYEEALRLDDGSAGERIRKDRDKTFQEM
jgi:hypothetical protein